MIVAFALAVMNNIDIPAQISFFRLFLFPPFISLPSFLASALIKGHKNGVRGAVEKVLNSLRPF